MSTVVQTMGERLPGSAPLPAPLPASLPAPPAAVDWPAALGPGAMVDFSEWGADRAMRHQVVVVRSAQGLPWLLAHQAPDALLLQAVELRLRAPVLVWRCPQAVLDAALAQGEGQFRALHNVAGAVASPAADAGAASDTAVHELSAERIASEASPTVRLLDAVMHDALLDGASDIHFENDERGAEVRVRIDGVMLALRRVEGRALAEHMVSRLKVLAELDIGERRLPQDGRFKLRVGGSVGGREIDFRLSIMPSLFGEDAVVRVLDRAGLGDSQGQLSLQGLGLPGALCAQVLQLARLPHGMLLVTGPTGSGKTTTLYATLCQTLSAQEKVITIEDPVEYRLAGVVQIPVNEKKGLSFARGLRSVLRHDPDRVLVGEIRDAETAGIAVQAALTGHLVFSTVHANSALDVIGRFMHMGLDLYNTVGAMNAVLAQRLLRVLCTHCARSLPGAGGWHAVGCEHCRHTGYKGRRAVAELLRLDDNLRDLIADRAPQSRIKEAARRAGMQPLREAALLAVAEGWTSAAEAERVVADV